MCTLPSCETIVAVRRCRRSRATTAAAARFNPPPPPVRLPERTPCTYVVAVVFRRAAHQSTPARRKTLLPDVCRTRALVGAFTSAGSIHFVNDNILHVSQWVIIQRWIRQRKRIRVKRSRRPYNALKRYVYVTSDNRDDHGDNIWTHRARCRKPRRRQQQQRVRAVPGPRARARRNATPTPPKIVSSVSRQNGSPPSSQPVTWVSGVRDLFTRCRASAAMATCGTAASKRLVTPVFTLYVVEFHSFAIGTL